jgi:hypothetical protein
MAYSLNAPTKARVIQLLDEVVLPKKNGPEARARGLLEMYKSLTQKSKNGLYHILQDRKTRQDSLCEYLSVRHYQSELIE